MTLENITVSLELAKKLKEAGYNHHTAFCLYPERKDLQEWSIRDWNEPIPIPKKAKDVLPAPTASELLEQLPDKIEYQVDKNEPGSRDYEIRIVKDINNNYLIMYGDFVANKVLTGLRDKSLPNALAKCWLYLKEEDLL